MIIQIKALVLTDQDPAKAMARYQHIRWTGGHLDIGSIEVP
jgi:hypothetical protein